jgi:beta-mannosidase
MNIPYTKETDDWMIGQWKLKDYMPSEGFSAGAYKENFNDEDWIPVSVPGDVHTALLLVGRIEDPFYDRNELQCAWIEDREWWYRLKFDGPSGPLAEDERLQLVFHGLDTFATIWLNEQRLGQHSNMFREVVFDVSDLLAIGQSNALALCFDRPMDHIDHADRFHSWGRNPERVFIRKAQFGFGWDWGPRLPTVGIWRPVELRHKRRASIEGVHFTTLAIDLRSNSALVKVGIEVERFTTDVLLSATVQLSPLEEDSKQLPSIEKKVELVGVGNELREVVYLQVEDPRLWWTHDLGQANRYRLSVTVSEDGEILDQREDLVGIRTIELDQSPDPKEPGTRFFRFKLNGVSVFSKGANWIPADSFVGTISTEKYERLIMSARAANMNMLRVWGGGIYEHDLFYELCDRLGILVWQDFMFACAMYPDHLPGFVEEVEAEARYQVRRLRNHPCIGLWCGNNECQWNHDRHFWKDKNNLVPGSLFYHNLFPHLLEELDGTIPYWPSSPYGGNDHNSVEEGDRHNWHVWHGNLLRRFGEEQKIESWVDGMKYERYAKDLGRFISEFGLHASPVFETLQRVIPPDQLYHHSHSMDHHIKDNPKDRLDQLMLSVTGPPKNIQEFVDFSMIAQAEGLKFAIEHFRHRKPHCSGTLLWQFNDCWPVVSWSIMDYYGFKKASYFYVKRAYAPVLASFKTLLNGGIELWVNNDTLQEVEDTVVIRLRTFSGQIAWEERENIVVPPNASQVVKRWDADQISDRSDQYLSVYSTNEKFPLNRHFFVAVKDLDRDPVEPEINIITVNNYELQVELKAKSYAFFVHLLHDEAFTQFSDNYFDMEPGSNRTIQVTNPVTPIGPESLRLGWR